MDGNTLTPAVACVQTYHGIPRLFINGKLTAPVCYLPSAAEYTAEQDAQEMKRAAQAGVNLLVIPWGTFDYADRDAFVKRLKDDILFNSSMSENPGAYIILRMDCNFAPEAIDIDEGERLVVNGGQKENIASLTSAPWYEHVKIRLRMIVEHVKSDPLLNARIIGYELLGGDSGEWFGPGYWDGYMDTSEPNRRAFCRFLRERYGSDAALQQAWGDLGVTLDSAPLPAYDRLPGVVNEQAQLDNVQQGQTLLDSPGSQHIVDYLDYTNELRTSRLAGFAKVVKEACHGEKLAMTYYGYHADCYTASSNHFAMFCLLESPDIDVLSAPVSYQDRCEGGIGAYMGLVDAVTAAGKLWMDEGDYRSPHHMTDPGLPYPPTTELLDQILRREMGKCMVYNTGVWWLSFNQGWFNYPSFWEHNREMTGLMERYNAVKMADTPEICYVLDERAMSLAGDANATGLQLVRFARTVLYRSGYRFGLYTLQDLLAGHIDDAKLYILVNPWRLDAEQTRQAAAHLHRPGKVTLYMYGSGWTSPENFRTLTGMTPEKWTGSHGYTPKWKLKEELDPQLADSAYREDRVHGITQALADLALTELNPVYSMVPDPGVTVLGSYQGGPADGKTGFASYTRDGWTSVFFGGMKFSPTLLAYTAGLAGVHAFIEPGDVLNADAQMVMLHVSEPGQKVVSFPRECDIYAVDENRWSRGDRYIIPDAYRGQTILLLYGDRETLEPIVGPAESLCSNEGGCGRIQVIEI